MLQLLPKFVTWPVLIGALLLAPTTQAQGRFYQLFQDGAPIRNYDQVVYSLQPGDRIGFSNGKEFTVKYNYVPESGDPRLGTTAVIAVSAHRVLRLPKFACSMSLRATCQSYLRSFVAGYGALRSAGVPVPQVDLHQSYLPEYVVVERLAVIERLRDLFSELEQSGGRAHPDKIHALKSFASSLWSFSAIGDFNPSQVALTASGYVLLDWTDDHVAANQSLNQADPFDQISASDPTTGKYLNEIHQLIRAVRESRSCASALSPDTPHKLKFQPKTELKWD